MFQSPEQVLSGLGRVGYLTDRKTATTIYFAGAINKPVLLEGPAGAGKTELVQSVARAARAELLRLQCYQGINEEEAIGQFDKSLQELFVLLKTKAEGLCDWEQIRRDVTSRAFFLAGPLLAAIEQEERCVLLIDEIDKVDHAFEAQAFERACSCFGLGRYFYDFPEMWVDLNEYGQPASCPTLPKWALPPGAVLSKIENEHRPNAQANPSVGSERSNNSAGHAKLEPVSSSLDASLTQQIEGFRRSVGDALYFETFRRGGPARNARELPNVSAQKWMIQQLEIVERGIMRVRSLAQEIHENAFYAVLDAHKVQSVDKIPSFEVLKAVVVDLQNAAHQSAA
jgi:hypothetical protein